jgi:hypothetical protein
MATIEARPLTAEHIRLITNPHAPFIAAIIDTMPSYAITTANIDAEAAKAAVWVSQTPAIINGVVAAGTDLTLEEARDLSPIRQALLFADVFRLTERAIGLSGVAAAIMDVVRPLSLYSNGARH